jgi:hypothetical protein
MSELEKPKSPMKIVGINLLVMVFYTIASRLTVINAHGEDALGGAFLLAVFIGIHVFVCLFTSVASKYTRYWLLSSLLVLLVGFSSCLAAFSI